MTWGCKPENYPDGCGWAARLTYPRMGHEEWWCDTCERAGDPVTTGLAACGRRHPGRCAMVSGVCLQPEGPPVRALPGHETHGWDGESGYRCACGQMLTEHSWANAEPLWRAHLSSLTSTTRPANL